MTPNLVCQPSRASILTGLLPLTHGVWDNGVYLDPAVGGRGFAGTLAAAGYRTALIGKAHFATKSTFAPTGTPECNKSQARYGPDWFGPYMGFQHVELCALGHLHRTRPLEQPPVGHYERWLISRGEGSHETGPLHLVQLRMPIMAGVVFGLFFVLLHQASQEAETVSFAWQAGITSVFIGICWARRCAVPMLNLSPSLPGSFTDSQKISIIIRPRRPRSSTRLPGIPSTNAAGCSRMKRS